MTKIVLQGEIHSSKNSRRIMRNRKTGNPFVAKSALAKADEESFAVQLAAQKSQWQRLTRNFDYPFEITFCFCRATNRRFDYVNLAQGILDAMVKADYLPDDSADYVIPRFVPYSVDAKNPGCIVLAREYLPFTDDGEEERLQEETR
jgi:Holliday junction resolvase RusA-like endonuclease